MGCFALGAFGQQVKELTVRLTALDSGSEAVLDGLPALTGGEFVLYRSEPPVPVVIRGRAILNVRDAGLSLVLSEVSAELTLREKDGGITIKASLADAAGAWIDVYHNAAKPMTIIELPNGAIGVPRGAVRAARSAEGGVRIDSGHGHIGVESSPQGKWNLILDADAENRVTIAADGTVSGPAEAPEAYTQMASDRNAIVELSLLPQLVRVAEKVAEGDIEPPTRGSLVVATTVAPSVRVKEIVPRGGLATQIVGRSQTAGAQAVVQSVAEAFIGSGEAALAVVGARLQRTRVIGAAGIARAPFTISREISPPFILAPLRR